jgi:hypothetical protein
MRSLAFRLLAGRGRRLIISSTDLASAPRSRPGFDLIASHTSDPRYPMTRQAAFMMRGAAGTRATTTVVAAAAQFGLEPLDRVVARLGRGRRPELRRDVLAQIGARTSSAPPSLRLFGPLPTAEDGSRGPPFAAAKGARPGSMSRDPFKIADKWR